MKQALWVGLDVCDQYSRRRTALALALFMTLWLSFQSGLVEGGVRHQIPSWESVLNRSLLLRGVWPGLALATLTAELLFSRRQKRELEPLLASAGIRAALWGCLLPALAGLPLLALLSLPAMLGGMGTTSQLVLHDVPAELIWNLLAVPAAGLWLLAAMSDAALRATEPTALMLRSLPGFIPVLGMEAGCQILRLYGWQVFEPLFLFISLLTGLAAVACVIERQTCERLIREVPVDA